MQITGSKFAFSGSPKIEDISDSFEQYRIDSKKLNQWKGVPKPPPCDARVLRTLQVVRDDSVSA